MKKYGALLFALAIMPVAINAQSQNSQPAQKPEKRSLRLLLEGDSDIAPYSFQELYKRGNEVGCEISFAHGLDDSYDARVVLTTGTGSEWCSGSCSGNAMSTSTLVTFAYGSAVVLMRDGKLLFTVSRSGSVRSLLIKELIDDFQVYYPTLKRGPAASTNTVNPEKPVDQSKHFDGTPAGLPAEPGIYYKSPNGWTRLSEAPVAGIRISGLGKSLLTWGLADVHADQIYRGGEASTQILEITPTFYVRTLHAAVRDALIQRIEKKLDSRELRIATNSLYGSRLGSRDARISPVAVSQIADDVVAITPKSAIGPGEYVIRLVGSESNANGYDFGIASVRK